VYWSVILGGEHGLKQLENRVLAAENMMCGPERETITGGWEKWHYEELLDSFSSSDIRAKQGEMGGTSIGEKKDACMFLVGEPEGKRLLGRPQNR
jgi:hypothetical protein